MEFFIFDIALLVLFSIFVIIFLYKRRKKIDREGILFLYRTKVGIKIIEYISKRYAKILSVLKYFVVIIGYGLMIGMLFLIGELVYIFVRFPEFIKAVKIPPIAPLIPYLPAIFKADFLPPFYFIYWITIIALVAIFHEFSHGIFARNSKIKIKSTGFAFLGPFLGAFVEPDEKNMKKIKKIDQLAILSAGSFANIILTIVFFFIFIIFFSVAFSASGIIFNTYTYDIVYADQITYIDNSSFIVNIDGGLNLTKIIVNNETYFAETSDLGEERIIAYDDSPALNAGLNGVIIKINDDRVINEKELSKKIAEYKPGDNIKITTLLNKTEKEYEIKLEEYPGNKSKPFIGIGFIDLSSSGLLGGIRNKLTFFRDSNTYYAPKINEDVTLFIYNFLWWIILINLSVALVNMLPMSIFDGGRVFYLTMLALTKSEKVSKKIFSAITILILLIFLFLMLLWSFSLF